MISIDWNLLVVSMLGIATLVSMAGTTWLLGKNHLLREMLQQERARVAPTACGCSKETIPESQVAGQ